MTSGSFPGFSKKIRILKTESTEGRTIYPRWIWTSGVFIIGVPGNIDFEIANISHILNNIKNAGRALAIHKKRKQVFPMESRIPWERDMEKALERAGTEGKPVLLFFHNPA